MSNNRKRILITVGFVFILLIIGSIWLSSTSNNSTSGVNQSTQKTHPTVTLNLSSLTDTLDVTTTFNNTVLIADSTSGRQWGYDLSPGNYNLSVTQPGYTPFTTSFTLVGGQPVSISVSLQLAHSPAPITNINQVLGTDDDDDNTNNTAPLSDALPADSTITSINYFANQTWAFLVINVHTGLGSIYVAAKYDPATKSWVTFAGPDDDFPQSEVSQMPSDMQNYIYNNYYIVDGE